MIHSLLVGDDEGDRVDRWLRRRFPDSSRREISRIISAGSISVAGRALKKGDVLRPGETVELAELPEERAAGTPRAESVAVEVLHEDAALLIINKPAGIPTHPLEVGELGCAANRVAAIFPECASAGEDPREGGAVHRLDRGTSGALVFARDRAAFAELRAQFSAGQVEKRYWALTTSAPDANPIVHPLEQRGRHAVVSSGGLSAETSWLELGRGCDAHLLECRASTGRRHQIRAHLAAAGAPIVGDTLYGGAPAPTGLIEFFLHAREIALTSPASGPIVVKAPLPTDRRSALELSEIDTEKQV